MRHEHHPTPYPSPSADAPDAVLELLDRERLFRRWRCGSDSFFWRMAKDDLLLPRHCSGLLRYAWSDVFAFEGGQPPEGLETAYRCDLLTPAEIAVFCTCSEAKILEEVKAGRLSVRRIGRASRFVPAEVERWQHLFWRTRRSRASRTRIQAKTEV